MERERILKALHDELEAAKQRRDAASVRFYQLVHPIPGGIPYPDSADRIARASAECTRAEGDVTRVLLMINDYLVRGVIPPVLHREPASKRDTETANEKAS
jgi:hypothetical protein